MTVSIVIPSYNHWDLTHSILLDIYKCFPQDAEVIVVDDASPDKEVSSGLLWWKTGLLKGRLKTFVNEQNCGFLKTCNFGVSKASNELVVLISNDVKINDTHIYSKIAGAMWDETLGRDNHCNLVGARLLDYDTGWNTFDGKIFPYLEGWLLAFWKSDWTKFGGFDERFAPNDYEDIDIATQYIANGGKLVTIEADVHHLGGQTLGFTGERAELTKRNRIKFQEKWLGENKNV